MPHAEDPVWQDNGDFMPGRGGVLLKKVMRPLAGKAVFI